MFPNVKCTIVIVILRLYLTVETTTSVNLILENDIQCHLIISTLTHKYTLNIILRLAITSQNALNKIFFKVKRTNYSNTKYILIESSTILLVFRK